MKRIFTLLLFALCVVGVANASTSEVDMLSVKSIDEVGVVARMPKQHFGLRKQAISSSVITSSMLESEHITSV